MEKGIDNSGDHKNPPLDTQQQKDRALWNKGNQSSESNLPIVSSSKMTGLDGSESVSTLEEDSSGDSIEVLPCPDSPVKLKSRSAFNISVPLKKKDLDAPEPVKLEEESGESDFEVVQSSSGQSARPDTADRSGDLKQPKDDLPVQPDGSHLLNEEQMRLMAEGFLPYIFAEDSYPLCD